MRLEGRSVEEVLLELVLRMGEDFVLHREVPHELHPGVRQVSGGGSNATCERYFLLVGKPGRFLP